MSKPLMLALVLTGLGSSATAQVHWRWNIAGYPVSGAKSAIILFENRAEPMPFKIVTAGDGGSSPAAHEGRTRPKALRWGQWTLAELDFTELRVPGNYTILLEHAAPASFQIGENSYRTMTGDLLGFMRQQRCGKNPWLNADCHPHDGRTVDGPMPDGTHIDTTGGWHDAADLLKYLLTSGNATAQLLTAYRLCPGAFEDHVNAAGEPVPNGLADVLDEARWGLDWMLKLHPAPGQLFHQVADDRDHCGWRLPQNEVADYGWGPGKERPVYFATGRPQGLNRFKSDSTGVANLAGRYAAAMALAYAAFKDVSGQRGFAERCLSAGREVYEMGRRQEGLQQGNSYGAPYRYAEATWADDMEWGAAELYGTTRDPRYLEEAKRYARLIGSTSWMGREDAGHYEFYPFINLGHYALFEHGDESLRAELAGYYREGLERCRVHSEKNGFGIGVPFIWCSNNLVVALVTQAALYEKMTSDPAYRKLLADHRDWLLGRNPWGYSMFTGTLSAGSSPRQPHLMTSRLTGRLPSGGLVDGPVYDRIFRNLKGATLSGPDPLELFQAEAVYHDDVMDYATNEPTMDGTASAVLMMALIGGEPRG